MISIAGGGEAALAPPTGGKLAELKAGGPDVSGLVLGTGPGLGGVGGLRLGSDMSMFLCWAWTWSPMSTLPSVSKIHTFCPSFLKDWMKESWGLCGAFSSQSHISPEPWAGHAHHLPPSCLLLFIDVKQMPSFSCLLSLACSL